jgi:hypothetical protein
MSFLIILIVISTLSLSFVTSDQLSGTFDATLNQTLTSDEQHRNASSATFLHTDVVTKHMSVDVDCTDDSSTIAETEIAKSKGLKWRRMSYDDQQQQRRGTSLYGEQWFVEQQMEQRGFTLTSDEGLIDRSLIKK